MFNDTHLSEAGKLLGKVHVARIPNNLIDFCCFLFQSADQHWGHIRNNTLNDECGIDPRSTYRTSWSTVQRYWQLRTILTLFLVFLLVQMHVKEYLVKEESSLSDSSLILYHWAEEDSIMSHIHSSILFTYLTLSTLLILSAYRPLVKDSKDIKSSSKDIKSSSKDIKNAIILLNF